MKLDLINCIDLSELNATSYSVFDEQDEEILHAVHRWEIVLLVEDVRDGSCCQIVHHQAIVDGGEVEGSEEARGRRRCEVRSSQQ